MARVFKFKTNATATPVEYVSTGGGGFSGPAEGSWQDVPGTTAIPVVLLSVSADEQNRASVDVDPRDRDLYFKLEGDVPIQTTQTLRIGSDEPELAADAGRYDVTSVTAYAVKGFEKVGIARVRKVG